MWGSLRRVKRLGPPMNHKSLVLEHKDRARSVDVKLADGKLVVGRGANCDVVLNDGSVSRVHAELVIDGDRVRIRDLKSRNGTFVGERPIEDATISLGESVRFEPKGAFSSGCSWGDRKRRSPRTWT